MNGLYRNGLSWGLNFVSELLHKKGEFGHHFCAVYSVSQFSFSQCTFILKT